MWPGGFLGNARPSGITLKHAAAVFMAVCSECARVHGEASASYTSTPSHFLSFFLALISHVTPLAGRLGALPAGSFAKRIRVSPQTQKSPGDFSLGWSAVITHGRLFQPRKAHIHLKAQ